MLPEIIPARAKKHLQIDEVGSLSIDYIVEEKFDGSRYLLYKDEESFRLLSRRVSEKTGKLVDKTLNCTHLYSGLNFPPNTILDGEIMYLSRSKSSNVTKIMGSLPERAKELQEATGYVHYSVFDILFYNGKDLRVLPLKKRHTYLHLLSIENDNVSIVKNTHIINAISKYNEIITSGGEGIILKDLEAPYGEGWIKVKRQQTFDVVISGFTEGTGKYKDLIGAVKFSLFNKDCQLVEVGQCSGMTDSERIYFTEYQDELYNHVLEVEAQEFTSGMRLRHPRFVRLREDKSFVDCKISNYLEV